MKQAEWVISNNNLSLKTDNNELLIPSAEDIFQAEFKNKQQINGYTVAKPSDNIPTLKLSRFPLDIKFQLTSTKDGFIQGQTVVVKNNEKIYIPEHLITVNNHFIVEDCWYPLVQGVLEELNTLLNQLGINDPEKITLRQYAAFRLSGNPAVLDVLSSLPLSKESFDDTEVHIPRFTGKLYPYQFQGYRWLRMISDQDAGCILADEMGLGKTAQIIALLSSEANKCNQPSLVIAPVTLMENWRREVSKFAADLKILIHQGIRRTGYYSELLNYEIVITSYETVLRDLSLFEMIDWNIVVLDEAQAIKNPNAKRTKALKQINRRTSIAVTGTPVENRLLDLWSLSDFAFPGFLGDIKQFEKEFPEELAGASSLEPIISPIMLRRRVKDVAYDLPDRIDIPQVLELQEKEIAGYEKIRQEVLEQYGGKASLVSLIKLRMYCTHPLLQQEDKRTDPASYIKYQRLVELLEEIVANKEKALVFTSYTEMIDIMVSDLSKRFAIHCDYIDGRVQVNIRQPKIDTFGNIDGPAILILNPRAAGAGLNITAANHVIHYNLEWNPAVEDQASARAYRRGQTRPVNVYRLFLADTVEEIINERVERKRALSDTAVVGNDGTDDYTDIIDALMKSPKRGI